MKKRLLWIALISVAVTTSVFGGFPIVTGVNTASAFILNEDGDEVEIFRDDFGVPHIFADTDRGLFVGFGYAVAEDRLWQLEANRRAARGQLAEIFGPDFLAADKAARTLGYTEAELTAMLHTLPVEVQDRFEAYVTGINRYITEVVFPDIDAKMPAEFHFLKIAPTPWSVTDVVAFGAFRARNFGEIGGEELENQELLQGLLETFGLEEGSAIFNDVRWRNDPDAPVTVPTRGAAITPARRGFKARQLQWPCVSPSVSLEDAKDDWEKLGVPTKFGSYGWVLSARRSKRLRAMLYGGPQMGFTTPSILLEVQLKGGESDFNVRGMTFAGAPAVLIGRNRHLAWTSTTGVGDNLDTYIEILCDAGPGPGSGYFFNSVCTLFEARGEDIDVAGESTTTITVLRSVHGPVIGLEDGVAVSQKRAHWMREMETELGFGRLGETRNLAEFEAAVDLIVTSHNLLYADRAGNIAYWQAGEVPVRPEGFDPRLPLPGTGEAEWAGEVLPTPKSINPARGWLANWNNKPSKDFDNADEDILGKQFRLLDLTDRLAQSRTRGRNRTRGQLSLADMEDIPKDIGRVKELGREARFLKPYLLDALDMAGTSHPAISILEAWDGSAVADVITSTHFEAAEVIFSTWLELMILNTFTDELDPWTDEAGTNMLIHVLDDALAKKGSGVPPSRDYFNGADPNQVMADVFDQTLAALTFQFGTPDPTLWILPRGTIVFSHPFLPVDVGSIPLSNRATYAQIVIFGKKKVFAESIQPLGQSGFISALSGPDVHFTDQLELFRNFEYKPMTLLNGP